MRINVPFWIDTSFSPRSKAQRTSSTLRFLSRLRPRLNPKLNVYRVCQFLLFSALILMLNVGCERPYTQGKYAFFWEMYDTIPYDSFDDNPVTPDGKTLMKPVPGTIPRGYMPYHYKKTPQDAERAGRELKSPIKKTRANLKRGKAVYGTFCLVCHGSTGQGGRADYTKISSATALFISLHEKSSGWPDLPCGNGGILFNGILCISDFS